MRSERIVDRLETANFVVTRLPWWGRRVSSFRWLRHSAVAPMRNYLAFGWQSRRSRSEDPQDREEMSCKIPYGIEENL